MSEIKYTLNEIAEYLRSNLKESLSGLVVFIVFVIFIIFIGRYFGLQDIQDFILSFGIFAPIISIIIFALTMVSAPLSATAVQVAILLIFGREYGALISFLGLTIGTSINFWISRLFGKFLVKKILGEQSIIKIENFFSSDSKKKYIVFLFVLLGGTDILSYTIGLSKMKFVRFALIIAAIHILVIIFNVYITSSIIFELINR
jgi:uncharacterized membrane protein YdjX (TVP38/TMEM64 family)